MLKLLGLVIRVTIYHSVKLIFLNRFPSGESTGSEQIWEFWIPFLTLSPVSSQACSLISKSLFLLWWIGDNNSWSYGEYMEQYTYLLNTVWGHSEVQQMAAKQQMWSVGGVLLSICFPSSSHLCLTHHWRASSAAVPSLYLEKFPSELHILPA